MSTRDLEGAKLASASPGLMTDGIHPWIVAIENSGEARNADSAQRPSVINRGRVWVGVSVGGGWWSRVGGGCPGVKGLNDPPIVLIQDGGGGPPGPEAWMAPLADMLDF